MLDPDVIVRIEYNRLKYLGHRSGPEPRFRLKNGFKVEKRFYAAVLEEVEFILDGMQPNVYYTARDLCGEDFWLSVRGWNRNLAGMCVADAVKRGWLPLSFKPKKRKDRSTQKYRIISNSNSLTN